MPNNRTLGGGGKFNPKKIKGLALWLDGADTASMYQTDLGPLPSDFSVDGVAGAVTPDGWWSADNPANVVSPDGRVVSLTDMAGSGFYFPFLQPLTWSQDGIPYTTAPQLIPAAINGYPAMRFAPNNVVASAGGFLFGTAVSALTPQTIIAVYKSNAAPTSLNRVVSFADYDDNTLDLCYTNANQTGMVYSASASGSTLRSPVTDATRWQIFSCVNNIAGSELINYRSGAAGATGGIVQTTSDIASISIGGSDFLPDRSDFDLAELMVWSVPLTTTQRRRVEQYLSIKYNIQTPDSPVATFLTPVTAPTDIVGCVGWWDASDQATIIAPSGAVDQWKDKSGLNNHATASGTARPTLTANVLNGRSVMTFDGTANAMTIAANSAFNSNDLTYFVVFKQASAANKGVYTKLNATVGTLGFGLVVRSDPQVWLLQKNAGSNQVLTASIDPTAQARIYSVTSSASAAGYLDGLSSASASGQSADHSLNQAVTIGARASSEYLNGYIAEIVHFNNALSSTDRLRVEKYLAAKWGTTTVPDPTPSVGYWADKSGNGRHAVQTLAANRPAISATTQGGKKALTFDGTNGWMRTERTTYAARSVITVFRRTGSANGLYLSPFAKQSNVAAGYGGAAYQVTYGNEGGWSTSGAGVGKMHYASNGSPHKLSAAFMRGAAVPLADAQNYLTGISAAPNTTDAELLYAEAATDTDGNQAWFIGTEPFATTRKYPANILELLIYNRALTAAERQRLERYLAARWGITLAPTVSNADAQDWINRVYANGGTVSSATASAVNTLCDSLDASGVRPLMYRMGIFCGSNLNAALVPLYRGPSLGGTQYGNATDTNVGPFVSGDYAETGASGGLVGNGSSKYLDTGFAMNTLPSTTSGHAAVYCPNRSSVISFCGMVGVAVTGITGFGISTNNTVYGIWGSIASAINSTNGLLLASRTSSSLLTAYVNGASIATSTTSVTPTPLSLNATVFANRAGVSSVDSYDSRRYCFYSLGTGLSQADTTALTNAVQAFQTAMSRA